jgi:hypothetical protein
MEKADNLVIEEFKKVTGGKIPDFYLYTVDMPPFWQQVLLAGAIFGAFLQKPYMLGVVKNTFYFLGTGMWSTTTFKPEKNWILQRAEIADVKYRKFGPSHFFTLTLKNGTTLRLVANTLYRKLEKHGEGIERLKMMLAPNA